MPIVSQYLWIRKDWLTKLGLEMPKNVEDVVALARAFRDNDPDGNGENDTWGLGVCNKLSQNSGYGETGSANPDDLTAFQYAMCWGPEFGSWTRYQEQRDQDLIVMSEYYGAPTDTMVKRWSTLVDLQEETFVKIISGSEPIEAFDTFVEQWKAQGGDTITAELSERIG